MKQDVLQIDPAVDVVSTTDGNMSFRTPQGDFTITDPFGMVRRVTDQCRQGVTGEDLEANCTSDIECRHMKELVDILRQRRILTTCQTAPSHDVITDWVRHAGGGLNEVLGTVTIEGKGHLAVALHAKLTSAGFTIDDDGDCQIAVSDHPNLEWLREMNIAALKAQRPFLPVWLDRSSIHWGPMVLPGATGCLECWWHRRNAASRPSHRPLPLDAQALSASPILADVGAGMVSAELLRWALDAYVTTDVGMAWRFDILTTELSGDTVLLIPRCPSCGAQP